MSAQEKSNWRVGRRNGQALWQVKQAPVWSVKFSGSLKSCAEFLAGLDVDLATVPVLTPQDWKTLAEWIALGVEPGADAPAPMRHYGGVMRPERGD